MLWTTTAGPAGRGGGPGTVVGMAPLGRPAGARDPEPRDAERAQGAPAPRAAKGAPGAGAAAKGRVGSRSVSRGRTTPKKAPTQGSAPVAPVHAGRYTPPSPKAHAPSPRWVPVLMFALWGLALLVIVLNYLELMPHFPGSNQPGGTTDNYWLITGLVLALGGFAVATRYR